jgi:hypothetical protein
LRPDIECVGVENKIDQKMSISQLKPRSKEGEEENKVDLEVRYGHY